MFKSKNILLNEFNKILLISIGAIPGVLIRWHLNNSFLVNLVGAIVIGFVIGYEFRYPLKLLIGVGFCGALTTFSTWIVDCLQLMINGNWIDGIALIILPLTIGLFVCAIGYFLGYRFKYL
tara:strand:- start:6820 stop:7182 length:363 start_codon:yes stop_codon:yes gene_type:complete